MEGTQPSAVGGDGTPTARLYHKNVTNSNQSNRFYSYTRTIIIISHQDLPQ